MPGVTQIVGYHAHIYYRDSGEKVVAAQLREALEQNFDVRMGRWCDEPVGPHPLPMFQAAFAPDQFPAIVPWLMLNRDGLTILVHPETGDVVPDHPRLLILGDGQTQGPSPWDQSVVGRIAHGLPFYEVLNGGAASYAPSVYLQIVNDLTSAGYEFDEVLVFMDVSDVQDEAAFYHDRPAGGVTGPARWADDAQWYVRLRDVVRRHLRGTNYLVERLEMALVSAGGFHLQTVGWGAIFDGARSAWPYRKIHETGLKFPAGYAPLGEEAGLAKAVRKMDRLSAQLRSRHISFSLAVYPWPAQLAYDDRASRHLKIWRE